MNDYENDITLFWTGKVEDWEKLLEDAKKEPRNIYPEFIESSTSVQEISL